MCKFKFQIVAMVTTDPRSQKPGVPSGFPYGWQGLKYLISYLLPPRMYIIGRVFEK